ncbi:MAG: hypothetical protein RL885_14020 [Planctomycetota bacterium]
MPTHVTRFVIRDGFDAVEMLTAIFRGRDVQQSPRRPGPSWNLLRKRRRGIRFSHQFGESDFIGLCLEVMERARRNDEDFGCVLDVGLDGKIQQVSIEGALRDEVLYRHQGHSSSIVCRGRSAVDDRLRHMHREAHRAVNRRMGIPNRS